MKKIFKKVGLILCSLVLAVGALFLPMRNNAKNYMAHADTTDLFYSFSNSNVFIPVNNISDTKQTYLLDLNFVFYRNDYNGWSVDFTGTQLYLIRSTSPYTKSYSLNSPRVFNVLDNEVIALSFTVVSSNVAIYVFPSFNNVDDYVFSGNIMSVNFYGSDEGSSGYLNYLKYNDFNNCSFSFGFYNYYGLLFENRTYYFDNAFNLSESQQFNAGYQQGLSDNQSNIYNNGYSAGQIAGYDSGYTAGVASANDYSFIGLIGAVVDVPFKTFQGALNYEILGINLFNLFTAVLTLGIILFVLKLVLGGK